MITCSNIGNNGRFGNQLFQFASLIGIGDKLNYEVLFPKKNLKQINISSTRENKTISQFKSAMVGGGARPNLFEVELTTLPGGISWDADNFRFMC